jgi:hypothetical protein
MLQQNDLPVNPAQQPWSEREGKREGRETERDVTGIGKQDLGTFQKKGNSWVKCSLNHNKKSLIYSLLEPQLPDIT